MTAKPTEDRPGKDAKGPGRLFLARGDYHDNP